MMYNGMGTHIYICSNSPVARALCEAAGRVGEAPWISEPVVDCGEPGVVDSGFETSRELPAAPCERKGAPRRRNRVRRRSATG